METNTMVAARVPSGIKAQGDAILAEINSNPTELINAAYEFLIKNKELPTSSQAFKSIKTGTRTLNKRQAKALLQKRNNMTYAVPSTFWKSEVYKDEIEEARKQKYESLS